MINKLDSRLAVIQFFNHLYDYRSNWTPLSPIRHGLHEKQIFYLFLLFELLLLDFIIVRKIDIPL